MISTPKRMALRERMKALHVKEEDLKEVFLSGNTKGGQKANKTATTVALTHRPTGIQVTSHRSRLREDNRYFARCLLVEAIAESKGMLTAQKVRERRVKKQKLKRKKRHLKKYPAPLSSPSEGA